MHSLEVIQYINRPVTQEEAREFLRAEHHPSGDPDTCTVCNDPDPVSRLGADERDQIIHSRIKRKVTADRGALADVTGRTL